MPGRNVRIVFNLVKDLRNFEFGEERRTLIEYSLVPPLKQLI
jgi:hypothetical protein